jgi:hypothetical protein
MAASSPFANGQRQSPAQQSNGPQSTHDFQPMQELDQNGFGSVSLYQSITSTQPHNAYSFEELRLNDYAHERGKVVHPPSDLSSFKNNLAFATVRQRLNAFSTPMFARRTYASNNLHLGWKIVTFRVGSENPQDYAIHESLIKPVSEFVSLALDKDWKEAKERLIPLPDDDPEVFELLQTWLYNNTIPSMNPVDGVKDAAEYKMLVAAYILGDKFGITDFKDAIIDSMILKLRHTARFDARLGNMVYDNTPERSPLRKLWQDVYVFAGNPSWLDEDWLGDFVHAEFTLDLSKYHMRMMRGQGPSGAPYEGAFLGECYYHEHGKEECYRKKLR